MNEETLDEILNGLVRVFQKKRGYRFSIDALLLAHFVSLPARSKVIDLGTGSGIVPLILAQRFPHTSWTGLEIQAKMAALADKNVELNGLRERVSIVHGDARKARSIFPAHSFDAVTCNPPYRKINSGRINPSEEKAIARHAVKNIGRPCAGKPHARFDEGGLASQLWCGYLGTGRRKSRKQISQPNVDHASSLLYQFVSK